MDALTALQTKRKRRFSMNKSKVNLFLDMTLATAFVLALEEHFTGMTLHELIGVFMGVGLLIHIILHLAWIVSTTRRFFSKLFHESRLNYVLNIATFIDLGIIIVTGIGISRTLGLELGLDQELSHNFEQLHKTASTFSLMLIGLHVGMHWKWIVTHVRRYILRWPFRLPRRQQNQPVPAAATVTIQNNTQRIGGGAQ